VLLHSLIAQRTEVHALAVDYGQRHRKELAFAQNLCATLGVVFEIANLTGITKFLGSALTRNDPIPEGRYAEDSMQATVVPNRNMIMLSVAAGWAMSLKADAVAYAAHAGDHTIYPDCRPEFANALDAAIRLGDWHQVYLYRPFVGKTKAELVTLGASLGVPFENTWSCYKGGEKHCGVCGTCIERREAFCEAGVDDPTEYAVCVEGVSRCSK